MSDSTPSDLIPLAEACRLLPTRPHISTLLRWILSKRVRGWRLAGRWLVSRAEVQALVQLRQPDLAEDARQEMEDRERAKRTDEVLRRAGVRG